MAADQSRASGSPARASPGGNLSGLTRARRSGDTHNNSQMDLPCTFSRFNFFVAVVLVVWSSLASVALAMGCELSGSHFQSPGLATNLNGPPTLTDGETRTITYELFQLRERLRLLTSEVEIRDKTKNRARSWARTMGLRVITSVVTTRPQSQEHQP